MKKICSSAMMFAIVLLLNGCASNDVRRFIPDPLHKNHIEKHLTKKVSVDVTMSNGDLDSIMCRWVGNIYLPNKMTYSQYIEDAFKKTLADANRLSPEKIEQRNLSVVLTKIDFSSTDGEWYINAHIKVDGKEPITIKNVTKFGTSWFGEYACKNVAESFEVAVNNFVEKVLTNHEVISKLRQSR